MDFSSPAWIVAIVLFIVIVIIVSFFQMFYVRSTKEKAFVRTGFGGQYVIMNDGALVLPIFHESMPINMNTHRIEIVREDSHALITKDRLRVNVKAEFHIRVKADPDMISIAARTLGSKTMTADGIEEQIEGFCVGSLRSVAAEMDMDELHEQRQVFSEGVKNSVLGVLEEMGLELVSVALTSMDQTDIEFFPADNALNVAGITYIKKQVAEHEKKQNELLQDKEVAIAHKNFEASRSKNAIKKQQQENRLRREMEIRFAELEQEKSIKERELQTELEIEGVEVAKEMSVMEYGRKEDLKRATIQRDIAETWIKTDAVKAEAAKAKERVITAQEKEIAERRKTVEIISANKEADRHRIIATGTADAEKIEASAAELRYRIEAAGKKALNEAANLLSNDQISLQVKQQIVNQLPSIIRESVKPIENIDGIKIVHVDGLTGGSKGGGGSTGSATVNGSLADQVVDSALRYKAQAPLVESLLKEVGLDGSDIKSLTKNMKDDISGDNSTNSNSDDGEDNPKEE